VDEHKTGEELLAEIAVAEKQIMLDAPYVHYKGADKLYKPIHFATLESNNELCVVYRALYGEKLLFIRPVSVWLETVEWHGKTAKRFTPVTTGL
jgi:hypothetical protein